MAVYSNFVRPLWSMIENVHKNNSNGISKVLHKVNINSPETNKFRADVNLVLDGISYPEFDSNSNLKIVVPTEFQSYYNTKVIDKKWILDVFEKSGAYRAWLEEAKPFFDEIAAVLPNEKYVHFFYQCYHAPKIDSNFTVHQFYQALKLGE